MRNATSPGKNWFDQGGQAYAAFRPQYPSAIASYLATLVAETKLALDVGCGSGQLTRLLAAKFDNVIGVDPSADQIAHAVQCANVSYQCSPAEKLELSDESADLITAAQAAHWFDLPKFFNEVRRVGRTNGVLALISYGVLDLEPDLNERFQHFYSNEIASFWPPERKLVDSGYSTIDFPFAERKPASMAIRLYWNLAEFLGYLSTWSAVRQASEVGRGDVLHHFADDMAKCWGDADARRLIVWKINMRIGKL